MTTKPELLAPAGQPDAGYAALHYGADAVYLGLQRFSARAEAANFSAGELAAFVRHAHSLAPRRRVYLTLNTLVKEREIPEAVDALVTASECDVDAVIVQDLGIAKLVRDRFPGLDLHASTQMAIHNLEGVLAAKRLGCSRVTLARELTLDEIADIVRRGGVEIEVFIHGTLCYSYSGLCLFSSLATGRSGNRGRCVYSCREGATDAGRTVHPFSLKDLALGPRVLDLAKAGVASLKIEGRKKSPLYVAATVDYYRRLLDGGLKGRAVDAAESKLKTIFARPWTTLFLDGKHNPDAADTDIVGHRGAPLAAIEKLVRTPAGPGIAFVPALAIERHDGIQIDLPGEARPYGFAVDNLYLAEDENFGGKIGKIRDGKGGGGKRRPEAVFSAMAGQRVFVTLPPDAPALSAGLPLYLSSSQEVKRSYPFPKGKGPAIAVDLPFSVDASIRRGGVAATATAVPPAFLARTNPAPLTAGAGLAAETFSARDPDGAVEAVRGAFVRSGGGRFRLDRCRLENPDSLFAKPGVWNQLRRDLLERLEDEYQARLAAFGETARTEAAPAAGAAEPARADVFSRSLCVDRPGDLAAFTRDDFAAADEVTVGIGGLDENAPAGELDALAERSGRDRLRLAVPLILRPPESAAATRTAAALIRAGWRRWLVPNLGALTLLGRARADGEELDLAADWPLYCLNRLAREQLRELGCGDVVFSPEDDRENLRQLLKSGQKQAHVVVYGALPLFVSAACAHAQAGRCPDAGVPAACRLRDSVWSATLEKSGGVHIQALSCGSVVTGGEAFSLGRRLGDLKAMGVLNLRVDLRWRRRTPGENLALWRSFASGRAPAGTEGNFERGLI